LLALLTLHGWARLALLGLESQFGLLELARKMLENTGPEERCLYIEMLCSMPNCQFLA
jgi:hypothetical protein